MIIGSIWTLLALLIPIWDIKSAWIKYCFVQSTVKNIKFKFEKQEHQISTLYEAGTSKCLSYLLENEIINRSSKYLKFGIKLFWQHWIIKTEAVNTLPVICSVFPSLFNSLIFHLIYIHFVGLPSLFFSFPPLLVPVSELVAGAEAAERTSQVNEERLGLVTLPLVVFEVSSRTWATWSLKNLFNF